VSFKKKWMRKKLRFFLLRFRSAKRVLLLGFPLRSHLSSQKVGFFLELSQFLYSILLNLVWFNRIRGRYTQYSPTTHPLPPIIKLLSHPFFFLSDRRIVLCYETIVFYFKGIFSKTKMILHKKTMAEL
jgi:hypothetical protein